MGCVECGNEAPKYKCPTCLAKYCSVACCKSHKANNCTSVKKDEKPKESIESKTAVSNSASLSEMDFEDSEDRVLPDALEQLEESEEVKALLHNPHLRAMLVDLVNSPRPARDMDIAMHEPLFLELADACLKVVEDDKGRETGS